MTDGRHDLAADETVERQRWLADHQESALDVRSGGRWRRGMFRGSTLSAHHSETWQERHWTSRSLHRVGELVAHSAAGIIATALVVGWALVGAVARFPVWWQTTLYSVTASVTFVMVFVIQHTQERQTSAMQRKLDELIRSSMAADDTLIAAEEAPDEHLQARTDLNVDDRDRAIENAGAP